MSKGYRCIKNYMICSQGCIIHFNHGMPHITGYMMSSIRYEGRIFNVNVESFERKRID